MALTCERVEARIREKFEGTGEVHFVKVEDMSDGCGSKFYLYIVADVFEGKALLAQQRLVNTALIEELKFIHALTMKTRTKAQYDKDREAEGAAAAAAAAPA